jgi:hypothetical protein
MSCAAWAFALGCGGSCPEARSAEDGTETEAPLAESEPATEPEPVPSEAGDDGSNEEAAAESTTPDSAEAAPTAEPAFPENASVAQAIAAVPQGSERLNVDHEALAAPLQDPEVYAPCNPGNQHFTMKIAVWNGRAVGVDVKAKDAKLASCLASRIRELEWKTKVRSLNTIEYGL